MDYLLNETCPLKMPTPLSQNNIHQAYYVLSSFPPLRPHATSLSRRRLAAGQQGALPQVLIHHLLDAPDVVLRFPQVVQPGPSLPLGRPLRHLHTLDVGAVYFDGHFHPDRGQLISKQHRRVRAGALDGHDDSRNRVARFERDQQYISHPGAVHVGLVEESRPSSRRVEEGQLASVDDGDGIFAVFGFGFGGFVNDNVSSASTGPKSFRQLRPELCRECLWHLKLRDGTSLDRHQ